MNRLYVVPDLRRIPPDPKTLKVAPTLRFASPDTPHHPPSCPFMLQNPSLS